MILKYIKVLQKSTSKVDIDIYCARAPARRETWDGYMQISLVLPKYPASHQPLLGRCSDQ